MMPYSLSGSVVPTFGGRVSPESGGEQTGDGLEHLHGRF